MIHDAKCLISHTFPILFLLFGSLPLPPPSPSPLCPTIQARFTRIQALNPQSPTLDLPPSGLAWGPLPGSPCLRRHESYAWPSRRSGFAPALYLLSYPEISTYLSGTVGDSMPTGSNTLEEGKELPSHGVEDITSAGNGTGNRPQTKHFLTLPCPGPRVRGACSVLSPMKESPGSIFRQSNHPDLDLHQLTRDSVRW